MEKMKTKSYLKSNEKQKCMKRKRTENYKATNILTAIPEAS